MMSKRLPWKSNTNSLRIVTFVVNCRDNVDALRCRQHFFGVCRLHHTSFENFHVRSFRCSIKRNELLCSYVTIRLSINRARSTTKTFRLRLWSGRLDLNLVHYSRQILEKKQDFIPINVDKLARICLHWLLG